MYIITDANEFFFSRETCPTI